MSLEMYSYYRTFRIKFFEFFYFFFIFGTEPSFSDLNSLNICFQPKLLFGFFTNPMATANGMK